MVLKYPRTREVQGKADRCFWWPRVTCSVCDSLRVCGGRCHTAWRSPPASGSGSRRCRPGRFRSSNLLTKHSGSHSGAFPQASTFHILTTPFHGKVILPQSPAELPQEGAGVKSGTPNTQGVQEPLNALGRCYRRQLGHLTPIAHKNQL